MDQKSKKKTHKLRFFWLVKKFLATNQSPRLGMNIGEVIYTMNKLVSYSVHEFSTRSNNCKTGP